MISVVLLAATDAESLSDALAQLSRLGLESLLLPVLCQIVVIVIAARAFFVLFRRLGQPGVIGEIVAGLVLGPSVLGAIWPQAEAYIFQPQVAGVDPQLFGAVLRGIFGTLAELGLVFLLFLIGLEFDFRHLRGRGRTAAAISAAGVALPFILGLALRRCSCRESSRIPKEVRCRRSASRCSSERRFQSPQFRCSAGSCSSWAFTVRGLGQ